jgi:nucleotide-binding universal stress UspA family protein
VRAIGVGFDGGREAHQALALASALAQRTGARLELLCAVTAPAAVFAGAAYEDGGVVDYGMDAQELISRTAAGLDADAAGAAVVGSAVESLVALSERVDLLVVGSRGWGRCAGPCWAARRPD